MHYFVKWPQVAFLLCPNLVVGLQSFALLYFLYVIIIPSA